MIFHLEHPCLVEKKLTLKAYNKIRRTTDIISHSSSDSGTIFNAFWWLKLSNLTGCFIACIRAHLSAVELDNTIKFRLPSGLI